MDEIHDIYKAELIRKFNENCKGAIMNSTNRQKGISTEEIKADRDAGMKLREIAEKYNITMANVCYHLKKNNKMKPEAKKVKTYKGKRTAKVRPVIAPELPKSSIIATPQMIGLVIIGIDQLQNKMDKILKIIQDT